MISTLRNRILVLSITILATGTACSNDKVVNDVKSTADMLSDRPIVPTAELFVVTLNSPALLTVSKKTANGWETPPAAKQQLLEEQAEFLRKLAALSSEAKVVYQYRLTVNGIAIFAPASLIASIRGLPGVAKVDSARPLARPQVEEVKGSATVADVDSVNFIGADMAHARGYRGQGMRVGILDTGIDYTHRMLGGSGVQADYAAVNPALPNPAFPNKKVVGGIDLVGTDFDASSPLPAANLPHPDSNPLDEAGHGTHVAGTVAGLGDGKFTYSGVAPEAQLYAVKVFGKDGSTNDAVVIAGFEYAADPNGDLNPDDQLDVINLSLGGGFGQPQILYNVAVRNLANAGTVVVASAGNSGAVDYIVGAPSTADEALSVAASVDGSTHNWRFKAVRFTAPSNPHWLAKATEGPISKAIADSGNVEGELVDIGMADEDLSDEVKAQLAGNVALIQRGKVAFFDKLKRAADAGAIGAVVYNNDAGKPIPMGGEGKVEIPAIMITQALGTQLKTDMAAGPVRIQFSTGELIEEPELIDSITEFSSKGPRSEDNLLKPEIAAPGARVISAAMGKGAGSVEMDGTSMAAPHMAGVMALIKQKYPTLSSDELKALAMNTAKPLQTAAGIPIPITMQGAGRVQVAEAVATPVVVQPPALSLGRVQLGTTRQEMRKLKLRNLGSRDLHLSVTAISTPGLNLSTPAAVTVPASGEVEVDVEIGFDMANASAYVSELNGRLIFQAGSQVVAQVPALAIRTQASEIKVSGTSEALQLTNSSPVQGLALPFNLIGEDTRKDAPNANELWKGRGCDMQSAGYRIITKMTPFGPAEMIQFAFKIFTPVTTWHLCEMSVLIDADGDGIADQEVASMTGVSGSATVLMDAAAARTIRLGFEKEVSDGKKASTPNYQPALLGMGPIIAFPQSTVAVLEVELSKLAKSSDGRLHVKLATQGGGDVVESDDYLGNGLGDWISIAGTADTQAFKDMDEVIGVTMAGASTALAKGSGSGQLVLYFPINELSAGQAVVVH
ncbi:MAG: S8 family serine peptidase [Bdellovibrionales bacterium]|nr:S8 family serine peptidase [Bdellovibrionales bacterium]